MTEKKKNALTDETITELNYTIEYLIQNGKEYSWPDYKLYMLLNEDGKRIFYRLDKRSLILGACDSESAPLKTYSVSGGALPTEDPEEVIRIAKELGVFDDWNTTQ